MKIFFVLTEYNNIISHGDLSKISYDLIKNLSDKGLDIEIFIPLYKKVKNNLKDLNFNYSIVIKNRLVKFFYKYIENIKINFIDEYYYFSNRNKVYGYIDDTYRFSYFSLCLLEYLKNTNENIIIHLFDWHFSILPILLKENKLNIPTVLTINNINNQGLTDINLLSFLDLNIEKYFKYNELEFFGKINILKAGLLYSNKILFYSDVYKNSILESNYLAKGLSEVLSIFKEKIECLPLGIDNNFNPKYDELIYKKYSSESLLNKIECKINLQKKLKLPIHTEIPIIIIPSLYMTDDEIILINSIIPYIMRMEIQIIIIGNKLSDFEKNINKLSLNINCSVLSISSEEEYLGELFSASDIFLDISSIGANELLLKISLKYGVIPILLKEYDYLNISDNKFRIFNFTSEDLINTIKYTINKYYYANKWNNLIKNIMNLDYSWDKSTDKFLDMYKSII